MIFIIDKINALLIVAVMFILGFEHRVDVHQFSFRRRFIYMTLIRKNKREPGQIHERSDIENVRTEVPAEWRLDI